MHWPWSHNEPAHCVIDGFQQKRSEEHTSELQSRQYLVCRLLLEKKKKKKLNDSRSRQEHSCKTNRGQEAKERRKDNIKHISCTIRQKARRPTQLQTDQTGTYHYD